MGKERMGQMIPAESLRARRRSTMTNGPAHDIRIGSLQATTWRNLGEKGNG
jgi:hypothetical protein